MGGDVIELRGRHGAEGELQRGEGAVLRDQVPEAAAHVLHLQLEVADARDAAQAHAAVVGDVKPTENFNFNFNLKRSLNHISTYGKTKVPKSIDDRNHEV